MKRDVLVLLLTVFLLVGCVGGEETDTSAGEGAEEQDEQTAGIVNCGTITPLNMDEVIIACYNERIPDCLPTTLSLEESEEQTVTTISLSSMENGLCLWGMDVTNNKDGTITTVSCEVNPVDFVEGNTAVLGPPLSDIKDCESNFEILGM